MIVRAVVLNPLANLPDKFRSRVRVGNIQIEAGIGAHAADAIRFARSPHGVRSKAVLLNVLFGVEFIARDSNDCDTHCSQVRQFSRTDVQSV
jgi:hypothetical protein